ncbi:beta-propeller fold lactonase family protein [Granulicella sp. 5B5]|uniref:lactonase family protein n=1 Tax=Granulicella sp. 5B5 TaxID=1617967 RepID=UPI0015F5FAE7|nr:beta-propeller fold lactonase family protein [Granulicella sp. 5B5]
MKFNTMVRTGVAAVTSLAAALGISACARDYTAAYVYSISSTSGAISAYGVDYQSGVITQIQGSPFSTQLTNPATIVSTPNGKYVYAVSGNQQAVVEPFSVGTDGKLYGEATVNLTGTYPLAATIDSTSTWLFVTYQYQTQYGPNAPGPGGMSIFKINSDGTLGTPTNVNLGVDPIGVTVSAPVCTTSPIIPGNLTSACSSGQGANVYVYAVDQETSATPAIIGFSFNDSTGAVSFLPGSTCSTTNPTVCTGIRAGVQPSAIVSEPTGRYVYVTDALQNEIFSYQIAGPTTANPGQLSSTVQGFVSTGLYPISMVVDPRGKYLYAANYNSATVSSYSISLSDGSLGGTASVGNFATQTGPTCITIEPALGIYLYTSDKLAGDISGGQLNANTGQLSAVPTQFFPTGSLPSCLTSVPNGPRANQLVYP